MKSITKFVEWCKEQHDVVCNQKYDGMPYSKHLEFVAAQAETFNNVRRLLLGDDTYDVIQMCCYGHDLIEDARVSYNDICKNCPTSEHEEVAEIIFLLTENKGRTRKERHNDSYWQNIAENKAATFVKICDFTANVKYGMLTHSRMLPVYMIEFERIEWLVKQHTAEDQLILDPMLQHLKLLLMSIG